MDSTKKNEVLIVLPEAPYPRRAQGISIRYLPVIKHISDKCIIDIIVISKESCDQKNLDSLKKYCRSVSNITHPNSCVTNRFNKFFIRCGFFLPWTLPRSWVIYDSDLLVKELESLTNDVNYSALVCVSGHLYPYIGCISTKRTIVDFVDSPSLLTRRNVIGSNRARLIRKFEAWKIHRWEARIIRESDDIIYISGVDASIIPNRQAPNNKRHVIPNGFSISDFTENIEGSVKSPSIGFFGNMSYFPNVEAACWLYKEVFSILKEKIPGLSMYIIGRDPDESIKALDSKDGVYVTGEVDLIWPYINAVDIFVFPLLRGAGLKNKILEAMYAKRLVITTIIGNEGIDAISGKDLLVCDDSNSFREAIKKYLELPEERKIIAESGRMYVEEEFSWDKILQDFEKIIIR